MKLKEYMALCEPGTEITCWDKDVDSEFYFYTKEEGKKSFIDKEFPNVDKCMVRLAEVLDVVKIHDGGIEVNLYEVLNHPKIIQYAKENFYEEHQYEDDADIAMLLFDDNDKNISQGFEEFSRMMVECLDEVFGFENELVQEVEDPFPGVSALERFIEIEVPFRMEKVLGIEVSDDVLSALIESVKDHSDVMFDYDKFDEFLGEKSEEFLEVEEVNKTDDVSLDDVINTCSEMSKNGNRDTTEKGAIDREER